MEKTKNKQEMPNYQPLDGTSGFILPIIWAAGTFSLSPGESSLDSLMFPEMKIKIIVKTFF